MVAEWRWTADFELERQVWGLEREVEWSGVGNECGTVGVMNQMYLLWVVAVGASK